MSYLEIPFNEFNFKDSLDEVESNTILDKVPKNRKISAERFYHIFCDFLEENKIILGEAQEDEERRLFKILCDRGLTGYKIIKSLPATDFINLLNNYERKNLVKNNLYKVFYDFEDENLMSFSDIYEKWNKLPPKGWIASWCSCGSFFPLTPDISEINVSENKIDKIYDFQVININLEDAEMVYIGDDNSIRISINGTKIKIFPFKMDNSFFMAFINNPLEII